MSRVIITAIPYLKGKELSNIFYDLYDKNGQQIINPESGEPIKEAGKTWFSCEAPVRTLIKEAYREGEPIDKLICLVSEEAKKESLEITETNRFPKRDDPSVMVTENKKITGTTSYQYFKTQIAAFLNENPELQPPGYIPEKSDDFFAEVKYDYNKPAECIESILEQVKQANTKTVDIDITSGPRTLPTHVTLCMEAMIYEGIKIRNIVYGAIKIGSGFQVTHEEYIYDVIRLINAVNDFTEHGKSDALYECLNEERIKDPRICKHADELGDSDDLRTLMKSFSDNLSICRVTEIINQKYIERINSILDDIQKTTITKLNEERISNIEKIFRTLVPAILAQFVENSSDSTTVAMHLMKWCVKRNMIQQALSLFREYSSMIVIQKNYIIPPEWIKKIGNKRQFNNEKIEYSISRLYRLMADIENPRELYEKEKDQITRAYDDYKSKATDFSDGKNIYSITDFLANKERIMQIAESKVFYDKETLDSIHVNPDIARRYGYVFTVSDDIVHDFVCCFYCLHFIRNAVMHAGIYNPNVKGKIELKTRNSSIPNDSSMMQLSNITDTIYKAIDLLEAMEMERIAQNKKEEEKKRIIEEDFSKALQLLEKEQNQVYQKGNNVFLTVDLNQINIDCKGQAFLCLMDGKVIIQITNLPNDIIDGQKINLIVTSIKKAERKIIMQLSKEIPMP